MSTDMTGKVCIVTGSNCGIGLETAAGLVGRGATAVLACRDEAKAALAAKTIASRGGAGRAEVMRLDFDDLHSEKNYRWMTAYSQSKLANVMFTRALARRLEGSGVMVNCLHPGVMRTQISRDFPAVIRTIGAPFMYLMLSPSKGARTSVYLATSHEVDGVSGEYFVKCKPAQMASPTEDIETQERLWDVSTRLTGVGG